MMANSRFRCAGATCPYRGRVNDSSIGCRSPYPRPGDVSICRYCCCAGIFDEEFLIRLPTAEEQRELDDSDEVQRVRGALLAMRRAG